MAWSFAGTLTNTAAVTGGATAVSATDTTVVAGTGAEIPALGPAGLLVLAGALGALALSRLGRRSTGS